MSSKRASLWDAIPADVRLQLVPIFTTLALVKAGRSTAELITRLREGTPFCKMPDGSIPAACTPNEVAIADLQGVLLLLNFVVILWFTRLGLKEALRQPGSVKTDAKIVGLGTAFATSLELYDYVTKAGYPERIVFTLLALLFVFIVPFFLMKGPVRGITEESDKGRQAAEQALAAFELLIYAVVPCVFVAIVCSLYYVILNEGLVIWGHSLVFSFVDTIRGSYGRAEFWGFNPGMLGVCWLSTVTIFAAWGGSFGGPATLSLRRSGQVVVLVATLVIAVFLGLLLIGSSSVIPRPGAVDLWRLNGAKAFIAVAVTVAFFTAFFVSRATRGRSPLPALLLQVALFAIAGAVAALSVVWSRVDLVDRAENAQVLIAMHSAGFALSLMAGRLGLAIIERRFLAVRPVLKRTPRPDRTAIGGEGEVVGFEGWTRVHASTSEPVDRRLG